MNMIVSYKRYKKKCLKVLNDSVKWNIDKLPDNTLKLQMMKFNEEIDEVIKAKTYQHQIEKLADVLIAIGGVARFNKLKAAYIFDKFIAFLDKFIFMDVVDYAEQKIKILYERDYSNTYNH